MYGGQAQRDASLYSILLYRLHFLLSQFTISAFELNEPLLLRWALSGSALASALAVDALCFVVRLAGPEVGWNLTLTVAELYDRIAGNTGEVCPNGQIICQEGLSGVKVGRFSKLFYPVKVFILTISGII